MKLAVWIAFSFLLAIAISGFIREGNKSLACCWAVYSDVYDTSAFRLIQRKEVHEGR